MTARARSAILRSMVEKSQTARSAQGERGLAEPADASATGTKVGRGSNGHAASNASARATPRESPDEVAADAAANVDTDVDGDLAAELGASTVEEPSPTEGESAAPEQALDDAQLERSLAALLFAANEPLSVARLAGLVGAGEARVDSALAACGERLRASGLPFDLRAIAGGWQLFTATDQDAVVTRLARVKRDEKVSPASLETLAIVAYRQPVTKAEIEAIRGVQVGPILRALVDRGFVRVAGRAEVPGHPLLYGTTRKFLDTFGLSNLAELPRDAELVRD